MLAGARGAVSFVLALLLVVSCTGQRPPRTVDSVERTGARPGDRVRVVRFNVKPGMRAQFEDFFWRSLKPAAETLRPEQSDPVGGPGCELTARPSSQRAPPREP